MALRALAALTIEDFIISLLLATSRYLLPPFFMFSSHPPWFSAVCLCYWCSTCDFVGELCRLLSRLIQWRLIGGRLMVSSWFDCNSTFIDTEQTPTSAVLKRTIDRKTLSSIWHFPPVTMTFKNILTGDIFDASRQPSTWCFWNGRWIWRLVTATAWHRPWNWQWVLHLLPFNQNRVYTTRISSVFIG